MFASFRKAWIMGSALMLAACLPGEIQSAPKEAAAAPAGTTATTGIRVVQKPFSVLLVGVPVDVSALPPNFQDAANTGTGLGFGNATTEGGLSKTGTSGLMMSSEGQSLNGLPIATGIPPNWLRQLGMTTGHSGIGASGGPTRAGSANKAGAHRPSRPTTTKH